MDCDFERENVDLKSVYVISVVVIVIVFGSEIFFLVEPQIGLNPLTGPVGVGLGPGKKTRLVNGPGLGHRFWPAGRVRV